MKTKTTSRRLNSHKGYTIAKKLNAFALLSMGLLSATIQTSAQTVTGSGTANQVVKFKTTGSVVENSMISDNGTNVGINLTSPAYKLDISGGDVNVTPANGYRIGGNLVFTTNNNFTNVMSGYGAGANTIGSADAFTGYLCGNANTTGTGNTGNGTYCLVYNQTGFSNTGIGYGALYECTGSYNTATGADALIYTTSANYNAATGYQALYANQTGSYNTASGAAALYSNQTGSYNVADGYQALYNNTSASNAAVGYQSLYSNTTGNYNASFGAQALYSNQTGSYNVAIGYQAAENVTTGGNTATGYQALQSASGSTGYSNTAFGSQALYSTTSGSNNTAVGEALGGNTQGGGNIAIGNVAAGENTTGSDNTAIGFGSLESNSTGSENTAVGFGAESSFTYFNLSNSSALGYNATPTASNEIVLGNSSVIEIGAYVSGITNLSDARFKKNIQQDVHGLDFILKLKPVTYNLDVTKLNQFLGTDEQKAKMAKDSKLSADEIAKMKAIDDRAIKEKEAIRQNGFLAQDVEQAAKDANYNFDGVKKPVNDKDHYGLNYTAFVVPLVKAVQEQQKMITDQQKQNSDMQQQITDQQKQIDELKAMVLANNASQNTVGAANSISVNLGENTIVLNQNVPNPFADKTIITYSIPQNAGTAQVIFYDPKGQQIKSMDITTRGIGQMTVYANDLANGIYSYTLIIDGKVSDTKRMVRTK